jgi:methionyl aminopeptidase
LRQADFSLEPGLVLAIEPMIAAGSKRTRTSKKDHWTVRTEDGQPSVHFEHTVAFTAAGPLVLTAPDSD